jgi:arsenate reductase
VALQIFGTMKCPDTRKAERFFKDRIIGYQFIDLAEKGISPGELASLLSVVGTDALVDTEGKRFKDCGLAYQDYDTEVEILADPLLLRTPIVRDGRKSVVSHDPAGWAALLRTSAGRRISGAAASASPTRAAECSTGPCRGRRSG